MMNVETQVILQQFPGRKSKGLNITRESVGIHTSMFLPEKMLYFSICCLSHW